MDRATVAARDAATDPGWLAEQLPELARLAIQLTGNRLAADELLLQTASEATKQGGRLG